MKTQRSQTTPHGGASLLKFRLRNGKPLPHPKPLIGPMLPYKELRDPAKFNARREAKDRHGWKGAPPEMSILHNNGGEPGQGKAKPNRYANMPHNPKQNIAVRVAQRRGDS